MINSNARGNRFLSLFLCFFFFFLFCFFLFFGQTFTGVSSSIYIYMDMYMNVSIYRSLEVYLIVLWKKGKKKKNVSFTDVQVKWEKSVGKSILKVISLKLVWYGTCYRVFLHVALKLFQALPAISYGWVWDERKRTVIRQFHCFLSASGMERSRNVLSMRQLAQEKRTKPIEYFHFFLCKKKNC